MQASDLIYAEAVKDDTGGIALHFKDGVQHFLPSTSLNHFLVQLEEYGVAHTVAKISRSFIIGRAYVYGLTDCEVVLKSDNNFAYLKHGTTKEYKSVVRSLGLFVKSS